MSMIDRKMLEKWLHDLRTTEVPQTQNWLHVDDGYCCLGRLIACADDEPTWLSNAVGERKRYVRDGDLSYLFDTMPPEGIQCLVGIDRFIDISVVVVNDYDEFDYIRLQRSNISSYLASLNDAGYSFKFIASVAGYLIEQAIREEENSDE